MKYDKGWTFIETLVVLTIVLILSAGVGFSAIHYIDKAKVTSAKTQIESFKLALQSYYIDCGKYPTTEQGLEALWQKPMFIPVPANWQGPYTDTEIPTDPWQNAFDYTAPGEHGLPFSIVSYGADGKEGGDGIDEDIISWKR